MAPNLLLPFWVGDVAFVTWIPPPHIHPDSVFHQWSCCVPLWDPSQALDLTGLFHQEAVGDEWVKERRSQHRVGFGMGPTPSPLCSMARDRS